ncbi:hypothetical protein HanXRQr2_Chr17g0807421 [Helianthus annuus]|uniref:Uncharacterized protein n=1 Tax=Helianthus annuus TaxID=4232 RepID=A0A9K3DKG8_HELAN|nr:hypothetical protein HanXRQr2_Chr17g0807421 [Helianthus annuus]
MSQVGLFHSSGHYLTTLYKFIISSSILHRRVIRYSSQTWIKEPSITLSSSNLCLHCCSLQTSLACFDLLSFVVANDHLTHLVFPMI